MCERTYRLGVYRVSNQRPFAYGIVDDFGDIVRFDWAALAASLMGEVGEQKMLKLNQIRKARAIRKSLGIRAAAGFMRNRGWTVEATVWVLCHV